MRHAFGEADGDVLTDIERAAHTGRRITARRARRQKRATHGPKVWSVGPLVLTPLLAVVAAIILLAAAAGAAIVVTHGQSKAKALDHTTAVGRGPATTPATTPATHPPTKAVSQVAGIFIRFADVAKTIHYMYCTQAKGCDLIDVAKDGSSSIAAAPTGGVWHRVERHVFRHDPCINTVQNGARVGKPGDLVLITTTDLRPIGTKLIKGIRVPARITGSIATHFQTPEQPGCTFSNFTDRARSIDAPVTEYTP